jgi:endo-alpha-1,4-polygalactosaminidase (GH114 family)
MFNKNDAVLIIGYDGYYVNVVNPKTGAEERWGMTSAAKTFKDAGNVFISYLN